QFDRMVTLFFISFPQNMTSYKMDGPHRGFCLIINNVNFNSSQRKGSCKDAEQLERVFTWLGLDVRTYTDLTSGDIRSLMQTWQDLQDHEDRNCFVCCILSHGESGAIYGTDEKLPLHLQSNIKAFKTNHFIISFKCSSSHYLF
uniref:Caspase 10 n=1 Tax=Corvus moneduloides TaxID=1196302 RepID=A0A8C3EWL8_CORMO